MKQKKQWAGLAIISTAAVLVCSLLVISSKFTPSARAAGAEADPTEEPLIDIWSHNPPYSATKITADTPDPSTPGETVTLTVLVKGNGYLPTGTVDILGADTNCHIDLFDASGSCDVTFNTIGTRTLKAYYSGDWMYNPSSGSTKHKVVKAATATIITSDAPDPSDPGQEVVVGVTVAGAGIPFPTGIVVIKGANTNCTINLVDGAGSCSVFFNSAGGKTLKAQYKGDANYAKSTGSDSHFVNKGSTTTEIISDDPDPSVPGQAVKVKVNVIGGAATPTGTVSISGAEINCTVTLSGGTGSCKMIFNTIGDKIITATYNGNKNYLPSTTDTDHRVENMSKTVITTEYNDPSVPGEAITVGVSVTGPGAPPTGTVDISGGDANCSIALSGGIGSCSGVEWDTAGTKVITATYNGEDPNYAGSVGTALHNVSRGLTTSAIIGVDPEPSAAYQMVLVTVTVTPNAPGVLMPGGYVGISTNGGPSVCTVTLVDGSGSCSVFFTSANTFTITATYNGDGNYQGSWGTALHTVQ
jgi:large repetitive protein